MMLVSNGASVYSVDISVILYPQRFPSIVIWHNVLHYHIDVFHSIPFYSSVQSLSKLLDIKKRVGKLLPNPYSLGFTQ